MYYDTRVNDSHISYNQMSIGTRVLMSHTHMTQLIDETRLRSHA